MRIRLIALGVKYQGPERELFPPYIDSGASLPPQKREPALPLREAPVRFEPKLYLRRPTVV